MSESNQFADLDEVKENVDYAALDRINRLSGHGLVRGEEKTLSETQKRHINGLLKTALTAMEQLNDIFNAARRGFGRFNEIK